MGGCASKPRDVSSAEEVVLAPVQAPTVPEKPVPAAAAPEEKKEDGLETKPAEVEAEVVQAETKPVEEEKKEAA